MSSSVPEPEPEQQQFTFASPAPATSDDAPDFDYDSWIEQSRSSSCSVQAGDRWMDAEAIFRRHHQEMMLRLAAVGLPEEAYELSLRDLTELPKPRAMDDEVAAGCGAKKGASLAGTRSRKPWRKRLSRTRSETMEGAGLIVKMFMRSPAVMAKMQKTSVSANSDGDDSLTNTDPDTGNGHSNTHSSSMQSKGHKGRSYNRESMGCYPFFKSRMRQAKMIADKE